jgi:hypothetical protein
LQGVVVGAKGRKGFSSSSFPLTFENLHSPFLFRSSSSSSHFKPPTFSLALIVCQRLKLGPFATTASAAPFACTTYMYATPRALQTMLTTATIVSVSVGAAATTTASSRQRRRQQ